MPVHRYTEDDLLHAAKIIRSGGTTSDAASALGVSKKSITRLQDRSILPRRYGAIGSAVARSNERHAAKVRYAKMQELIDGDRLTQSQLAIELGVTRQRINSLVARGKISFGAKGG